VVGDRYLPWWGTHQLQRIYLAFPALEALLRLVPGLYSAWLRLWGSRVGRNVYWTPGVKLTDRSMFRIGDNVVFGQECAMSPHVITWRDGALRLLIKPITIGDGAVVGAQSGMGPGARIAPGATVRARQEVQIDEVVDGRPRTDDGDDG